MYKLYKFTLDDFVGQNSEKEPIFSDKYFNGNS